jgi:hypothetical protein
MSLRTKLDILEQRAKRHYDVLRLPDGTEILYTGEDALEALCASIDQEDHWFLTHLRQAHTHVGVPGLIWALEGSKECVWDSS